MVSPDQSPEQRPVNPVERFLSHVHVLGKIRDTASTKMQVDSQRLIQLGNLLNASLATKDLREEADLNVGKMIVNWWKANVESDIANIDRDVTAENLEVMRWWHHVIDNELMKIDAKELKSLTKAPPCPFKDKVEELELVMRSITATQAKMQEALVVVDSAMVEVMRPGTLLELLLERVEEQGMPLEELPGTLVTQVLGWRQTRDGILRHKIRLLAEAVSKISTIL